MYTFARGSSDYPFELWLGRVSFACPRIPPKDRA